MFGLWEQNGFVGKLEFIRENHEVSREAEKIVEQLASKVKQAL
jgi:hypothetical protein